MSRRLGHWKVPAKQQSRMMNAWRTGSRPRASRRRRDREGLLPMQRPPDALGRLPVRPAFIILDCCFAGTFQWPSLRDIDSDLDPGTPMYRERYDSYLEHAAWQVLTSTRSDERALDT